MRRVIPARVGWTILLLLAVSLISFLLLDLSPGSIFDRERLSPKSSPELVASLEARYGLDQPWYVQYGHWLSGLSRFDLGYSIRYERAVTELLAERIPETLALALTAHASSLLLAVSIGLVACRRPGNGIDRALSAGAVGLLSVHPVVLAMLALLLAASTGLFPIGGGSSAATSGDRLATLDRLWHLVLPVCVLTLVMLPALALQARTAFVEALGSPVVRAARSRGLAEANLVRQHAAPLAMLSILSFWGASFGRLLSAAFLVEVATRWPGMGPLTLEAVAARDPFLLLGAVFVASVLLTGFNLANDLLLSAADPRVRLEERAL